jgi:hypothetical protein
MEEISFLPPPCWIRALSKGQSNGKNADICAFEKSGNSFSLPKSDKWLSLWKIE